MSILTFAIALCSQALVGCDEETSDDPSEGSSNGPASTPGVGPGPNANTVPQPGAQPSPDARPHTDPAPSSPQRSTSTTGTLFFQNAGKTAVLDMASGLQRYIQVRGLTDVSADGRQLLFTYYDDDSDGFVVAVGDRTGAISETYGAFGEPMRDVRFAPGGELLLGLNGPTPAPLVALSRRGERLRVVAVEVSSFAFMPDGRVLLTHDDSVLLLDVQTGKASVVTRFPGQQLSGIAPSPDGRRVALSVGDAGLLQNHVYVFDLLAEGKAGRARQLTNSVGNEADPAWSPDGAMIAVRQGVGSFAGGGCPLLYVVDASAAGPVLVGLNGVARGVPMHDDTGFARDVACAGSLVHWR